MKLTLILDAAPAGVRASLVEEWEDTGVTARMVPMIRHFDAEEQAVSGPGRWRAAAGLARSISPTTERAGARSIRARRPPAKSHQYGRYPGGGP